MYFTRKQAAAVLIAVTVSQFFGLHLVEACNKPPSKPSRPPPEESIYGESPRIGDPYSEMPGHAKQPHPPPPNKNGDGEEDIPHVLPGDRPIYPPSKLPGPDVENPHPPPPPNKPDPEPPKNSPDSSLCVNDCDGDDYIVQYETMVCASDGELYENKCKMLEAQCEKKQRLEEREGSFCKDEEYENPEDIPLHACDFQCNSDHTPVCGSDGETYYNGCLLETEGCESEMRITKLHDGPCKDQEPSPEPPVNKSVQRMSGAQVRGGRSRTSSRARGRSSNPRASSRRDRFRGSRWRG